MVAGTAFQPNQGPKATRFFYFKKWGIGDKLNFQQASFALKVWAAPSSLMQWFR